MHEGKRALMQHFRNCSDENVPGITFSTSFVQMGISNFYSSSL